VSALASELPLGLASLLQSASLSLLVSASPKEWPWAKA
jgi:hypothetical protein